MIERLREIGLFGGLGDETLGRLCAELPVERTPPGTVLFREGEAGRELFVILDGEVEILRRSRSGRETRMALLGPCDWFGDMSVIDVLPRSATARVVAPAELLRLPATELDALYRRDVRAYSLLVLNIAREMSHRLRLADGLLADFVSSVFDLYAKKT